MRDLFRLGIYVTCSKTLGISGSVTGKVVVDVDISLDRLRLHQIWGHEQQTGTAEVGTGRLMLL